MTDDGWRLVFRDYSTTSFIDFLNRTSPHLLAPRG